MTKTCTIVVGAQGERCGAPAVVELAGGQFAECAEHCPELHIEKPKLFVGARVHIPRYGKIFAGEVTHIARTRVEVRFTTTGGKVKSQFFPIEEILL